MRRFALENLRKAIFGIDEEMKKIILFVIGAILISVIEFLHSLDLRFVAPSPHDSSQEALGMFRSAFLDKYREVQVGSWMMFP